MGWEGRGKYSVCARAGVTMQDLTDVRLGKSIWSRGRGGEGGGGGGGGATVKRSIFDRRYGNGQSAETVDRYPPPPPPPPYDTVRGLGNTDPERMGEVWAYQSRAEGQECELLSVVHRTDTRNAKLTPKKVSYAAYYLCWHGKKRGGGEGGGGL